MRYLQFQEVPQQAYYRVAPSYQRPGAAPKRNATARTAGSARMAGAGAASVPSREAFEGNGLTGAAEPRARQQKPVQRRQAISYLAGAMALLMLLLCGLIPSSAAQTQTEIEAELKKIEERIQVQEEKITELKAQQADQEKLLPALEEEIAGVEAKAALISKEIQRINNGITQLKNQINTLDAEIAEGEAKIEEIQIQSDAKQEEIQTLQQKLMERLRDQYMTGPVSNLQLLLSSSDLTDLLTISEYINRQAEEDAKLRLNLEVEMRQLDALTEELKVQQELLGEKKIELQKQSAVLVEQLLAQQKEKEKLDAEHAKISKAKQEIYSIIEGLEKSSKEAQKIIRKDQAELKAFEAKLDAILYEKLASGEISGIENDGHMIWPFPYKDCYITSNFGVDRGDHMHKGVDISIADKSKDYYIIAALGGVIVEHGFHSSMGNYVVIYHGYYAPMKKTIKTTYMHMKSFASDIANNKTVKAGKVLGYMGSTGRSTGPHLHFQINEISGNSSTPVNPLKYVSKP